MKQFEITTTEGERTAWIYPELDGDYEAVHGEPEPGRLAIKIRHVSPREAEKLTRKMVRMGIQKDRMPRGGITKTEQVVGREFDRDRLYAEAFVADWQGFVKTGEPLAYTPDGLAALLSTETWLNKAIGKATEEFESFFASNGNGSSAGLR